MSRQKGGASHKSVRDPELGYWDGLRTLFKFGGGPRPLGSGVRGKPGVSVSLAIHRGGPAFRVAMARGGGVLRDGRMHGHFPLFPLFPNPFPSVCCGRPSQLTVQGGGITARFKSESTLGLHTVNCLEIRVIVGRNKLTQIKRLKNLFIVCLTPR